MDKLKTIKLRCKMKDPNGVFIPRGMIEELTIEIIDGMAIFYFKNNSVTRKFAYFEMEMDKKYNKPQNTFFDLRTQKAATKYDGKKKEEIRDIVLDQLRKLGAKNIK